MDRKNMALILSIFLFVGLLFSVDPLERERDYNYGETHQIYSAGAGLTSGVSAIKTVRRIQTTLIYCLFLTWEILYGKTIYTACCHRAGGGHGHRLRRVL